MKDWFVPSIGFFMFVYFMLFVVLYAIKIGGANVPLYQNNNPVEVAPKTDAEKFLQDISKSIKESF